jgi:hypothetical protein
MRWFLTFLLNFTLLCSALAQPNPARIGAVKTWEDLQAVAPIDLGDGVKIRLGLEAVRVRQWSGALLYCLAEGYTPPSSGSGSTPFGPVHAHFAFGKEKTLLEKVKWGTRGQGSKGTYLYVRTLPIDRVGTYHVTVTDHQGKVLARSPVEGTRDFFHPWMPWVEGLDEPVMPREGIALPNVDSFSPAAVIEPGKARKGKLPTFLPSDDQPKLTIKLENKEIIIHATSTFTTSRPDYHFLARWWVNDKPFVPKQADRLWIDSGYGLVSEDKELRLQIAFRPERLGAKPGDRIGLQLMHAEGQWSWCSHEFAASHHLSESRKEGENVRVSNRVEFVVPKR